MYIKSMVYDGVKNLHETKYEEVPTEQLLRDGMRFGFQRMCIIQDTDIAFVCFSIYIMFMYIKDILVCVVYECIYTLYTIFLCLQREEEVEKHNGGNQWLNIQPNNPSDASGSSTHNSSSE